MTPVKYPQFGSRCHPSIFHGFHTQVADSYETLVQTPETVWSYHGKVYFRYSIVLLAKVMIVDISPQATKAVKQLKSGRKISLGNVLNVLCECKSHVTGILMSNSDGFFFFLPKKDIIIQS